ncbi:MAG: nucleotidyltransferase domain-containing protein [Euryarchaeota archaeon]|nr:nucleotidyltransferase domain-containing protein [Euryarchaeota archaeon]
MEDINLKDNNIKEEINIKAPELNEDEKSGEAKMNFFNAYQEKTVQKLIGLILDYYNDNLVSFVIYGSYARDEARLNSDIDLFIILTHKEDLKSTIERFYENIEKNIAAELTVLYTKYGIDMDLSPFILSTEEANYFHPIYLDMIDNAELIYDKNNFFKQILNSVSELKTKYGFRKEPVGNTFLWDIKNKNLLGERI